MSLCFKCGIKESQLSIFGSHYVAPLYHSVSFLFISILLILNFFLGYYGIVLSLLLSVPYFVFYYILYFFLSLVISLLLIPLHSPTFNFFLSFPLFSLSWHFSTFIAFQYLSLRFPLCSNASTPQQQMECRSDRRRARGHPRSASLPGVTFMFNELYLCLVSILTFHFLWTSEPRKLLITLFYLSSPMQEFLWPFLALSISKRNRYVSRKILLSWLTYRNVFFTYINNLLPLAP